MSSAHLCILMHVYLSGTLSVHKTTISILQRRKQAQREQGYPRSQSLWVLGLGGKSRDSWLQIPSPYSTQPRGSVHRVPTSLTVNSRLAGICSVHLVLSSHNTSAHVIPSAWGVAFPSQPHYLTHPLGLSFSVTASGSPQHCSGSLKPLWDDGLTASFLSFPSSSSWHVLCIWVPTGTSTPVRQGLRLPPVLLLSLALAQCTQLLPASVTRLGLHSDTTATLSWCREEQIRGQKEKKKT